jgi:hypothetical protein
MSLISDTWHELVRRRLWPVALGLLAALAAAPLLLAREPEVEIVPPVGATTAPAVPAAGTEMTEPVVALADGGVETTRRRVLGAKKDPFAPAPAPKKKRSTGAAGSGPANSSAGSSGGDATSSGAGSPGGGEEDSSVPSSTAGGDSAGSEGATSSPAASSKPVSDGASTTAPEKTYARYTAVVRFGAGSPRRRTVEPLEVLPSTDDPVAMYLGVSRNGKQAVFLLGPAATTDGDGDCLPSPDDCEAIELRAGESQSISVTDENGEVGKYRLDVSKIRKAQATAKSAQARLNKTLRAGRRALRGLSAAHRSLRYRLDARTGTARKLSRRAFKAAASAAARAAAARAS